MELAMKSQFRQLQLEDVQISYDASGGGRGGGLLKPSECRHVGGRGLAKSLYSVYSG